MTWRNALAALAFVVCGAPWFTAEAQQADSLPRAIGQIEERLRQAGAAPSDLAKLVPGAEPGAAAIRVPGWGPG
jgi:hypothetical protein